MDNELIPEGPNFKKIMIISLSIGFIILLIASLKSSKKEVKEPKKVRTVKITKVITKHVGVPKNESTPDDTEEEREEDDESDDELPAVIPDEDTSIKQ